MVLGLLLDSTCYGVKRLGLVAEVMANDIYVVNSQVFDHADVLDTTGVRLTLFARANRMPLAESEFVSATAASST